jgi:hypothetical protein
VSASSSPGRKHLARAFVVGCAVLAVFAAPAAASPPPCWKTLLNDWYDGHIDKTYPIPCYHQAIAHLPTDIKLYSNAKEDIQRALAAAIAGGTASTPTTTSGSSTATTTTSAPPPKPHKSSPISNAIKKLTPGGADAFPLPLLILGVLALLLILAGIAGMIWRRYQGRRGTT